MSEIIDNKQVFSLLEVLRSVQKTIANRYTQGYWIKAEINKLNYYQHSGHVYPELVEKTDNKIVAQIRATLWKEAYRQVNQQFINLIGEPIREGIKVLLFAQIHFDPNYGLSLNILQIDPNYTLGDLQAERIQTIQKLQAAGIFDLNKQQSLPILPKRIAVISVESSKGYADFKKVLEQNPYGYKVHHTLFPSLLQGDKAVHNIIRQLVQIEKLIDQFDAVAIIRGGGGDIGLSCFNNYELSHKVATFPLPIFTGIGHATNETVIELIAYQNAITPTQLGEIFINKFYNFEQQVVQLSQHIIYDSKQLIEKEYRRIEHVLTYDIKNAVEELISSEKRNITRKLVQVERNIHLKIQKSNLLLQQSQSNIKLNIINILKSNKQELAFYERFFQMFNEQKIMKLGFARIESGKPLDDLAIGDHIRLKTSKFDMMATINEVIIK